MTSKISVKEGRTTSAVKEKANLLKGELSYAEHYGYLMDWYLNDRKAGLPQDVVKESLHDVLDALKELNSKVEGQTAYKQKSKFRTNLFSRLYA